MEKQEKTTELFFPYYVNQGRLLDLYAILNGGYSEYIELTTAVGMEYTKSSKTEATAHGGFKLFNLGGGVSSDLANLDKSQSESKEKKIQTVTSVLSIVKASLLEKGYIKGILQSDPGDFICLPVVLKVNSIKSLLTEMKEIVKLMGGFQKIGIAPKDSKYDTKTLEDTLNTIQVIFGGDEILYESDDFAVTGNITETNLYQATKADIIDMKLNCLAQVKRVFPDGTELMKNTVFTRLKDKTAKENFIKTVSKLTEGNVYNFESIAVPSIYGKPVYQIEIIALYQ